MVFFNIMKYKISFVVLFESVMCNIPRCPEQCKCEDTVMECQGLLPAVIPQAVSKVVVYEVQLEENLDFNDTGWLNVTYLSINPGTSVFETRKENMVTLNKNEFSPLKNLEYLQIACLCLWKVQEGAFFGLDQLKVLDLSSNTLTAESFVNVLSGNQTLLNLQELSFSKTSVHNPGVFKIGEDFLNAVKNKPLKKFDISQSQPFMRSLNSSFFEAFSSLKKLNVSRSTATLFLFNVYAYNTQQVEFPGFLNLESIDFSYPLIIDYITSGAEWGYIKFSPGLKELYARMIAKTPLKLYIRRETSFPDFEGYKTFCILMSFRNHNSSICVIGEINIEKFDVAENSFGFVEPEIMKHLNSIRYLDFSNNILGDAFSQKDYLKSTIANLKSLEVLLVSYNEIAVIPDDSFEL